MTNSQKEQEMASSLIISSTSVIYFISAVNR
jgi:hypothetical protein